MASFFPNIDFAWIFLGILFSLLALASSTDLRKYVIPKWITLAALALGVICNIIRGAWLGANGQPVWILGEAGAVVGALDGFLFALCGFLMGFGLFFVMWVLGACGGGDVKLFGALGSWVGPYLALWVLLASLPVVFCLAIVQMMIAVTRGRGMRQLAGPARNAPKAPAADPRRRVLGFSLPLTIATAAVLLWFFRVELQLASPPPIH